MKHLHYGSIVIAISDQLASTFETAAYDLMAAGRSAVWPVSGYRDDREEVSIQLAVGPGIAFAITDTWLPDERQPSRYDSDSIEFIDSEHDSLEKEQMREGVHNVLVYGRFDRGPSGVAGEWRFSGHPAVTRSQNPQAVVKSLNREGIEVVNVSEGTAATDMAGSDLYIVGRYIGEPLE
ncbi:hypothetical protein [Nesterenkonia sp. DZ6]|uniref:hypothetical protein n=1 Tax=Nesterenkonia sp. DZ6 TaxID=2901229 RepID=UPI001F4CC223|nr:hypothetical protein [Nesterenkonia sp. DZ6]MCH8560345.1 hypothetical protein [Nesterenkonia sp. DZ6]